MKFREHRGQLKESLKTEIEVESFEDIFKLMGKKYDICQNEEFCPGKNITVSYYGYDPRVDQDLFAVVMKWNESNPGMAIIGFAYDLDKTKYPNLKEPLKSEKDKIIKIYDKILTEMVP